MTLPYWLLMSLRALTSFFSLLKLSISMPFSIPFHVPSWLTPGSPNKVATSRCDLKRCLWILPYYFHNPNRKRRALYRNYFQNLDWRNYWDRDLHPELFTFRSNWCNQATQMTTPQKKSCLPTKIIYKTLLNPKTRLTNFFIHYPTLVLALVLVWHTAL